MESNDQDTNVDFVNDRDTAGPVYRAAPSPATSSLIFPDPRELLASALEYASLGYPVFPCKPLDKAPLTPNGLHDATTDEAKIKRWLQKWPNANVAINCEGLVVIDPDIERGGPANPFPGDPELAAQLQEAGAVASTPRGGRHYIYRQPEGKAWRNTSHKLADDVDTRANGGYILVAPSVVEDKKDKLRGRYEWIVKLDRPHDQLPEPPEWLIADLDWFESRDKPAPPVEVHATGTAPEVVTNFNRDADWKDILEPQGWRLHRQCPNGVMQVTRPDKAGGCSGATIGHVKDRDGNPALYVFSGSVPELPSNKSYDKAGVYARLNHNGNFSEATRALGASGKWGKLNGKAQPKPATYSALCNLENVINADHVWLCGNKRAAESAQAIGHTATAPASADSGARLTNWTPLAGKSVSIIVGGGDAGAKYAECVAGQLKALAPPAVVRVVKLPGLGVGDDIGEWIDSHGDAAEPETIADNLTAIADRIPWPRPRFLFFNDQEFDEQDFRPEWLIKNILVRNQPALVVAPSKALKTTLSVEAALSLASGTSFLGRFEVPHPVRVAFISGESGGFTLQETARRMIAAKGFDRATIREHLFWCMDLPIISDPNCMALLLEGLVARQVEVCYIDPVYLCMGDVNPANMFEVGMALKNVTDTMYRAGITAILIHHTTKNVQPGKPLSISDISFTGFEQFARQFMLLNRREPCKLDGIHKLYMSASGSFGHGKLYEVDADEGTISEDFSGRHWDVNVYDASEASAYANGGTTTQKDPEAVEEEKTKKRTEKCEKDEGKIFALIDAKVPGELPAVSKKQLKTVLSSGDLSDALERLLLNGTIEVHKYTREVGNGAMMPVEGYRRPRPSAQLEFNQHGGHGGELLSPVFSPPCSGPEEGNTGGHGGKKTPSIEGASPPLPPVPVPRKAKKKKPSPKTRKAKS